MPMSLLARKYHVVSEPENAFSGITSGKVIRGDAVVAKMKLGGLLPGLCATVVVVEDKQEGSTEQNSKNGLNQDMWNCNEDPHEHRSDSI